MRPLTRPFARTFVVIFAVLAIVQGWYTLTRREAALAFKPTDLTRKTDFDKTHAQMVTESIRELVTQENTILSVSKISRKHGKCDFGNQVEGVIGHRHGR